MNNAVAEATHSVFEPKNGKAFTVRTISFDGMMDWPDVKAVCTFSRKTIWLMERKGLFPRRRQLSAGRVGWMGSEVLEWIKTRPVAKGK